MQISQIKILYLHGLDSSRNSAKFHVISAANKICIDVDYRNLSYASVHDFYQTILSSLKPDVLIGHCLGAYWAFKLSKQFGLPVIVSNPWLEPDFRDDYPALSLDELSHEAPKLAYLELGDENIAMHKVKTLLNPHLCALETFEGGHHHLVAPEKINLLIDNLINHLNKSAQL